MSQILPYNQPSLLLMEELDLMRKRHNNGVTEKKFGKRLAAVRKAAGYTQEELAKELGVSRRIIAYYEAESQHPPTTLLPTIAKILRVTTDELLGLEKTASEKTGQNSKTKQLWKKFQKVTALPEKDQRAIMRMVNSLSSVGQQRKAS